MSERSALVTGGAGFIGSHLTDLLVREGWRVRVLDDFSSGRRENLAELAERVDLRHADLRDGDAVASAVDGVEVVFHQAAIPSVPRSVAEPLLTHAVNVTGTLTLLEAARAAGCRRLVLAASCAAYGNAPELPKHEALVPAPASPYAAQKIICEDYCRMWTDLFGLETVSLRYFNVYGPRQDPASDYAAVIPRFVSAAVSGEPPTIYGDGDQTRDFVYVGDVARANRLAADAAGVAGAVINVAGGQRASLNQLLNEIGEALGRPIAARYEAARAGDVRHSEADLSLARERLGYSPEVALGEGLARTARWFRERMEAA